MKTMKELWREALDDRSPTEGQWRQAHGRVASRRRRVAPVLLAIAAAAAAVAAVMSVHPWASGGPAGEQTVEIDFRCSNESPDSAVVIVVGEGETP